jgi:hypothetical protein
MVSKERENSKNNHLVPQYFSLVLSPFCEWRTKKCINDANRKSLFIPSRSSFQFNDVIDESRLKRGREREIVDNDDGVENAHPQ